MEDSRFVELGLSKSMVSLLEYEEEENMDIPVLDEHPEGAEHVTSSQKAETEQKKEPRAFD